MFDEHKSASNALCTAIGDGSVIAWRAIGTPPLTTSIDGRGNGKIGK